MGEARVVPGDTVVTLDIFLTNRSEVAVVDIEIEFDPQVLTPKKVIEMGRAEGAGVTAGLREENRVRILWSDLSRSIRIAPGDGAILILFFNIANDAPSGRSDLRLVQITVGDADANQIPTVGVDGAIVIVPIFDIVVINEVLADPHSDSLEGDANRDGVRDRFEDEFIEILNISPIDSIGDIGDFIVDIGDWTLGDVSGGGKFVFPEGTTIAPGERIVLFGGGSPSGFAAQVFTDDGRIGNGLANSGDTVLLIADAGDTVDALTSSDWNRDQSLVRFPEGTGEFVQHSSLPGKGKFSPGRGRALLSSISVEPDSLEISVGEGGQLEAIGIFSDGESGIITANVEWESLDSTIIEVDRKGLVTALREGEVLIRALGFGFAGTGSVSSFAPAVTVRITSSPIGAAREDEEYVYRVTATYDNGDIQFFLEERPDWLTIDPETGVLRGTPRNSDVGTSSVRVRAEGSSSFDVQTFTLNVQNTNDLPIITSLPVKSAFVGRLYLYNVEAVDEDGDVLRFVVSGPESMEIDEESGVITWTPGEDDQGVHEVNVSVFDGRGGQGFQRYTVSVHVTGAVVINEILFDPAEGLSGDANGDGIRDAFQDEFVELMNAGDSPVDIGGWTLGDDDVGESGRFVFPEETIIAPGERIVLFGGGVPSVFAGQVFVDDGRIGNGLANSGDSVTLMDSAGALMDSVAYDGGVGGQSLVRWPEGTGAFVEHVSTPGKGALFSPGRERVVLIRIMLASQDTSITAGDSVQFWAIGIFSDGSLDSVTSVAEWTSSDTSVAVVENEKDEKGLVVARSEGATEISARVGDLESPPQTLVVLNKTAVEEYVSDVYSIPTEYSLLRNYPNPFNLRTIIEYELPQRTLVTIEVYNVQGQVVEVLVDFEQAAGRHSVVWSAQDLSSGVYICRMRAGSRDLASMKILLLK